MAKWLGVATTGNDNIYEHILHFTALCGFSKREWMFLKMVWYLYDLDYLKRAEWSNFSAKGGKFAHFM